MYVRWLASFFFDTTASSFQMDFDQSFSCDDPFPFHPNVMTGSISDFMCMLTVVENKSGGLPRTAHQACSGWLLVLSRTWLVQCCMLDNVVLSCLTILLKQQHDQFSLPKFRVLPARITFFPLSHPPYFFSVVSLAKLACLLCFPRGLFCTFIAIVYVPYANVGYYYYVLGVFSTCHPSQVSGLVSRGHGRHERHRHSRLSRHTY